MFKLGLSLFDHGPAASAARAWSRELGRGTVALWRLLLVVYSTSKVYACACERNATLRVEAAVKRASLRIVHVRGWRFVIGH